MYPTLNPSSKFEIQFASHKIFNWTDESRQSLDFLTHDTYVLYSFLFLVWLAEVKQ